MNAVRALIVVACLALAGSASTALADARAKEAEAHYQRALALLAKNNIETRRMAMRALEQATLLAPESPTYQLTLARTYYQVGFLKSARHRFEKVVGMTPQDADGRFGLGQVWRRDWLKYLDRTSLQRAIDNYSMSARLKPQSCDAWLALVPLLVEQDDLRAAAAAASRGLEAEPRRSDALLASAYTAYRIGDVARADSTFRAAYPRLPKTVRERFDDISPVATEQDTAILNRLSPADQREFKRRFWKGLDPDLASPENEAQLEYWARVAHAYFLFFNPKRREWDERGEVYVRYGPPRRTDYNPVNMSLTSSWGSGSSNVLVWDYPELGMRVVMEDRLLTEYYRLPVTMTHDPDPAPNPDSLAGLGDAFAASNGRGVFSKLPPGVEPLPVEGAIARFDASGKTRLLAQIEAPGTPGDSLWAEWVVLDSTRREVARAARTLAPSDCDATELRAADFATELPAGHYQVGLSVRDQQGRRGLYRVEAQIATPARDLALSDIVVSCGSPSLALTEPQTVRIAPNPGARVAPSTALTAYFEIYHLMPGKDGQSRFEYVYTVKSANQDPRIWLQRLLNPRKQPSPIEVSRQEENFGDMRRQFVTVPVQGLPSGRYKLEIRVRDLVAGDEVVRSALFVKVGTGG